MKERFLIAEYCAAPFYMGWWLYLRESNDGRPNTDPWDPWGWLNSEDLRRPAVDLLRSMGEDPPEDGRHSQKLAEWFAARFPNGLRVEVGESLRLVEQCSSRPRARRRYTVRTIRGAAMADRATENRERP